MSIVEWVIQAFIFKKFPRKSKELFLQEELYEVGTSKSLIEDSHL